MNYIGYIQGYSNAAEINHCPYCGNGIGTWKADGTAYCDNCDALFGVVEFPKEEGSAEG